MTQNKTKHTGNVEALERSVFTKRHFRRQADHWMLDNHKLAMRIVEAYIRGGRPAADYFMQAFQFGYTVDAVERALKIVTQKQRLAWIASGWILNLSPEDKARKLVKVAATVKGVREALRIKQQRVTKAIKVGYSPTTVKTVYVRVKGYAGCTYDAVLSYVWAKYKDQQELAGYPAGG